MPGIPWPPHPTGNPPQSSTTTTPTGPVAPHAHSGWTHLTGVLATQVPSTLQQARVIRNLAFRALR